MGEVAHQVIQVVTALGTVLRGIEGRNPGNNDDHDLALLGRGVRMLASGLAVTLRKPDDNMGTRRGDG